MGSLVGAAGFATWTNAWAYGLVELCCFEPRSLFAPISGEQRRFTPPLLVIIILIESGSLDPGSYRHVPETCPNCR